MSKQQPDYQDLWKIALAQIEVKLDNPTQFKTWFVDTQLQEIDGHKAYIGVKNHYCADWLRRKHHHLITSTLAYVYGSELEVNYRISEELANLNVPKLKTTNKLQGN